MKLSKFGTKLMALVMVGALLTSIVGIATVAMAAPPPHPYSQNIALVPNASGLYPHGGALPTSGFGTLPDGVTAYNPTFTNLHPSVIKDPASVAPLANFDTVVLINIEDTGNFGTYLNDATFLTRIHTFIADGGKLIIYTSETRTNIYWNNFIRPFDTTNPGALGRTGPLSISENNTLSEEDNTSFYYIDVGAVSVGTDAVGDAGIFTTYDANWCEDMEGLNAYSTLGPVHAYSHYGYGLIIYNGLDIDYMDAVYGGAAGELNLEKIWKLELLQPWNPTGLVCGAQIAGQLSLEPLYDDNPVGQLHCVIATLLDGSGAPASGVSVNFTVSGANSAFGQVVTLGNGEAQYCYTGANTGLDTIVAACEDPDVPGIILTSNDAYKDWMPGEAIEVGGDVFPANKAALLAPWIALAVVSLAGTAVLVRRLRTQS